MDRFGGLGTYRAGILDHVPSLRVCLWFVHFLPLLLCPPLPFSKTRGKPEAQSTAAPSLPYPPSLDDTPNNPDYPGAIHFSNKSERISLRLWFSVVFPPPHNPSSPGALDQVNCTITLPSRTRSFGLEDGRFLCKRIGFSPDHPSTFSPSPRSPLESFSL